MSDGTGRLGRVLAIGALALSTLVVAGGGALATGAGAAKKQPPSQTQVAAKLATQVRAARTPTAGYKALIAVMKAVHVGVYTAAGKPVVRGAERNARDFYLYDFELRIVADALREKRTGGLEPLAANLFGLGVGRSGAALPSGEIEQLLVQSVRAARARPRRTAALPALLLRELGLRQSPRYDLAGAPAPDAVRLDALQELLILADVAGGRRRAAARWTAAAPGGCSRITGDRKTDKVLGTLPWPGTPADLAGVHAHLVMEGIKLQDVTPGAKETHYGLEGHAPNAGKQLLFRVRAVMTIQVPRAIRCGPLAGQKLPRKGNAEDIHIDWSDTGFKTSSGKIFPLRRFGVRPSADLTDRAGAAEMVFSPNKERVPGFGGEQIASGSVTATVTVPFAESPLGEGFAYVGRARAWPVRILYHEPRGFKFAGLKWRLDTGVGVSTFEVMHARKCGAAPDDGPWAVIFHEVSDYEGGGGPGYHYNGQRSGSWTPGEGMSIGGTGVANQIAPGSIVRLIEHAGSLTPPFSVEALSSAPGWEKLEATADVAEDVDNGAFTWSCADAGF